MSDVRVRGQLTRGARIRAVLDQPRHAPLRLADETALILAVQSGALDPLAVEAVAKFREALPAMLDRRAPQIVHAIETTGKLSPQDAASLRAILHAESQAHESNGS
jgi:F-type H+-transporting ATPase subunit alpha